MMVQRRYACCLECYLLWISSLCLGLICSVSMASAGSVPLLFSLLVVVPFVFLTKEACCLFCFLLEKGGENPKFSNCVFLCHGGDSFAEWKADKVVWLNLILAIVLVVAFCVVIAVFSNLLGVQVSFMPPFHHLKWEGCGFYKLLLSIGPSLFSGVV